jgi:hypothetical protein
VRRAAEYEQRVIGFFDAALLAVDNQGYGTGF